jgi:hypothetical protein
MNSQASAPTSIDSEPGDTARIKVRQGTNTIVGAGTVGSAVTTMFTQALDYVKIYTLPFGIAVAIATQPGVEIARRLRYQSATVPYYGIVPEWTGTDWIYYPEEVKWSELEPLLRVWGLDYKGDVDFDFRTID